MRVYATLVYIFIYMHTYKCMHMCTHLSICCVFLSRSHTHSLSLSHSLTHSFSLSLPLPLLSRSLCTPLSLPFPGDFNYILCTYFTPLQHAATHCNTLNYILCTYPTPLQHAATYCNTPHDIKLYFVHTFQPAATHCNTMQNTQTYFVHIPHPPFLAVFSAGNFDHVDGSRHAHRPTQRFGKRARECPRAAETRQI